MLQIKSFQIDHNNLKPGVYLVDSRHDIQIFDLRFYKPNTKFISSKAMHTIEHLMATWLKTIYQGKDNIISFCPGACKTMFYLEVYGLMDVRSNLIRGIDWCLQQKIIPGVTKEECGNYKLHDLERAKTELLRFKNILIKKYL